MTTTLVLGGPHSGTSQHAENLLRQHERVTCVSTQISPHLDPDHQTSRMRRLQDRRPEGWQNLETRDLTRALLGARNPVLVDGISAWLAGQLDDHRLWDNLQGAQALMDGLSDELAVAAQALPFEVVLVTHDVGWPTGRLDAKSGLFAELLGHVNYRLSTAATRVHAVIAGRVLDLSDAPLVRR